MHKFDSSKSGFIAMSAVVMLSLGSFAFLLATMDAAVWFLDSVSARERRIQHKLDDQACKDTRLLILAKDSFLDTPVFLSDFNCIITP